MITAEKVIQNFNEIIEYCEQIPSCKDCPFSGYTRFGDCQIFRSITQADCSAAACPFNWKELSLDE